MSVAVNPLWKFVPVSVNVVVWPLLADGGLIELIVGVAPVTVIGHVPEGVPAGPFRTCAVNEPAASVAGPLNCVPLRVSAETTHDVLVAHPGPRKNTSAFDVL